MQESPGLNPDWCWEFRSFSIKNPKISLNINHSRILLHIGSKDIVGSCLNAVYHFLVTGIMLPFFYICQTIVKYNEPLHIFNIRMLIFSWAWALFGLGFWIIFNMSVFTDFTVNICQLGSRVAGGLYCHFWLRNIALQKRN